VHEDDAKLTVKFVKRQVGSSHLFTFPDPEDIDTVGYDDIVANVRKVKVKIRI